MVQFLSIIFFSWISSIFVGFFKISLFCVTLYYLFILCALEDPRRDRFQELGSFSVSPDWTAGWMFRILIATGGWK